MFFVATKTIVMIMLLLLLEMFTETHLCGGHISSAIKYIFFYSGQIESTQRNFQISHATEADI